jgi:hypothetical protein
VAEVGSSIVLGLVEGFVGSMEAALDPRLKGTSGAILMTRRERAEIISTKGRDSGRGRGNQEPI